MSRRSSQQQPPVDSSQAELEEEEVISGQGEGDEVMEDVQNEEEGYSMFLSSLSGVRGGLTECFYWLALGSSTPTSSLTWISWFCALPGHEYFCEVAEDFIEDDFNLTGLNAMVPFWKEAMEMVLDVEPGACTFHLCPFRLS